MKRIVLTLFVICFYCASASAQLDMLNRIKDRAKNSIERKIENRVEQKVDSTVNGAVDKALDKVFKPRKKSKNAEDPKQEGQQSVSNQTPDVNGTNATTAKNEAPAPSKIKAAKAKYAKSDFVPGDEIFFDDDFEHERLGERDRYGYAVQRSHADDRGHGAAQVARPREQQRHDMVVYQLSDERRRAHAD